MGWRSDNRRVSSLARNRCEASERTIDLGDDREVDVVEQVKRVCACTKDEQQIGGSATWARAEWVQLQRGVVDVRRGMSTRNEPSLCLPWNSAALSVPSLFLRSRTTGLMIHGTAADAMTVGKRRFVSKPEQSWEGSKAESGRVLA